MRGAPGNRRPYRDRKFRAAHQGDVELTVGTKPVVLSQYDNLVSVKQAEQSGNGRLRSGLGHSSNESPKQHAHWGERAGARSEIHTWIITENEKKK